MDPNAVYKANFQALADKLGRTPKVSDPEWLELHNVYSRSWAAAEEVIPRAAGPDQEGFSRKPAPQARTGGEEAREEPEPEPLSGPGTNPTREGAVSEPAPAPIKPRPSERPITGSRGVNGGILAVCRKCGRDFERPARRGRPPVMCEECR